MAQRNQLFAVAADGQYQPASKEDVIAAAKALLDKSIYRKAAMSSPAVVKDYLAVNMGSYEREVFSVVLLDAQNRVIECREMFQGTLTQTSVYPREIVKLALTLNAASVILAHNHPSGCADPSRADEALTQTVKAALALVDVRVLDHMVVAGASSPPSLSAACCEFGGRRPSQRDAECLRAMHSKALLAAQPRGHAQAHHEIRDAATGDRGTRRAKRLALARDVIGDDVLVVQPSRPQDRVIEPRRFDHRSGVAIGVQHAACLLPKHLVVNAHRTDEHQAFDAAAPHGFHDRLGLLGHRARQVRVDRVMPRHRGFERLDVGGVALDDAHPRLIAKLCQPLRASQKQRELDVATFEEQPRRDPRDLPRSRR